MDKQEGVLTCVEHAREAYIQSFTCSADEVRTGKFDWNPWIKGYATALRDLAYSRGEVPA